MPINLGTNTIGRNLIISLKAKYENRFITIVSNYSGVQFYSALGHIDS